MKTGLVRAAGIAFPAILLLSLALVGFPRLGPRAQDLSEEDFTEEPVVGASASPAPIDLFGEGDYFEVSPSPGAPTPVPGPTPRAPIACKGDVIRYLEGAQVAIFEGHARLDYKNMTLKADKITFYTERTEAFAEGNVEFYRDGDYLFTDKLRYDLLKEQGMLAPGRGYFDPWYGQAEKVVTDRTENVIAFEGGSATTCDLEDPHYRIESSEVLLYPQDSIAIKNAVFYVYDVPVFYWPYYRRSLQDHCQGFFMYPGFRNAWGFYLLSGYHWCAPDISLTAHLDWRYRRGFAYGLDGTFYVDQQKGKGEWRSYYTRDPLYETTDATTGETVTSEEERYLLEGWYRHSFPWQIQGRLEAHYFSDVDIRQDFFRREYEANSEPQSTAYLGRVTPDYTLSLQGIKRLNKFYQETEKLPELKFQAKQFNLGETKFYYDGTTAYTRFGRLYPDQDSAAYKADRFDTYHQMSYSDKYFGWLSLIPYGNFRETFYSRAPEDTPIPTPSPEPTAGPTPLPRNPEGPERSNVWRTVWGAGLKASTSIYGVFDAESDILDIHRLRHVIQPFANYVFTAEPNELRGDLYQFDSIDKIDRADYTELGIRNLLQTKRVKNERSYSWTLLDFLIKSPLYTDPERDNEGNAFGDLFTELKLTPFPEIGLDEAFTYNMYTGEAQKNSFDLWLAEEEIWKATLHHEYNLKKEKNELGASVFFRVSPLWAFRIYGRTDLEQSEFEEEAITIYRDLHCWDSYISYRHLDATDEHEVMLVFWIKAFSTSPLNLSN
jgi:LPS-assembly protein